MSRTLTRRLSLPFRLLLYAVVLLMLEVEWQGSINASTAQADLQEQVCDPLADYFLGLEDYPETIRLHLEVIKRDPSNALAHYHLGYAYGMTGRRSAELAEYRLAVELGLTDWDLFLNLGLVYLESGRLQDAVYALRTATMLAPARSEPHFNLGLVYERQGKLPDALQEMLIAEQLDPNQPDIRNMIGVIYAEMGQYERAQQQWSELLVTNPTYELARLNLARLKAELQSTFSSDKAITAAKVSEPPTNR